ncbi:MAG: hypothetical protein K2G94_00485 [Muribaculaceae bacterium]|nr:hypothetical protein [Muribaculaceae bacterium]
MKKTLLFTLSPIVGAFALNAAAPMQQAEAQAVKVDITHHIPMASKKSEAPVKRVVNDGTTEFTPTFNMPNGTFYGGIFTSTTGSFYSSLAVMPTSTPLTLVGKTWTTIGFNGDPSKYKYSWYYFSGTNMGNVEEVSFDGQLPQFQMPASLGVYRLDGAIMEWSYENLSEQFYPYYFQFGGKARVGNEQTLETLDMFVNPYIPELKGNFEAQEAMYGTDMPFSDATDTYTDLCKEIAFDKYSVAFANSFGEELKDADIAAFGFYLGYAGVPYALSSFDFYASYTASNGGVLRFNLVKADEKGQPTDESVYVAEVNVPASSTSAQSPFHVDFTSIDEYDEELSYIMVDSPLIVLVTGFKDFEKFVPFTQAYYANENATWGITPSAGTMYNLYGETVDASTFSYLEEGWSWGDYCYRGFLTTIDVEYPVLSPVGYVTDKATEAKYFDHSNSNRYAADMSQGETAIRFEIASSSEYVDEIVMDTYDLPEWLDVAVYDLSARDGMVRENSGEYAYVKGVALEFTVKDGKYEKRTGEVTLYYKNQAVTLIVGQDGAAVAGINDVEAAADGAVEYFDVQGRKLQAAPANGFFLQRQGNKVTKVIR